MGFRNELGFRFAFAGTRDIFGDENDHHFEPNRSKSDQLWGSSPHIT
jgi:hypothetical protein